jgi:uncharacterized protein
VLAPADHAAVESMLGRPLMVDAVVVVRRRSGEPVVIRNHPLAADGTPMPTRYWLVDPVWRTAVSRVESAGGVRGAEAAVPGELVVAAHRAYAAERDAALPADHDGPRPSGGVGGTRQGVKCLHAHVAHLLAGGDDAVGRWALDQLDGAALPAVVTVEAA